MADLFADAGAWIEQAGKDFVQLFEGDKAVESDGVVESDKVSEEVVEIYGPPKVTSDDFRFLPDGYEALALGGSEGDDLMIVGEINYNLWMEGGGGRDVLVGSGGNDYLFGGRGEDYLYGGAENDVLIGGPGADVFAMSKGTDQVWDFNLSQNDKISIMSIDGIDDGIHGMFNNIYTGRIEIKELNFGDSFVTILMSESGDQMFIEGATGSDVYNSIIDADPGQLVAVNFEVLA